MTVVLTQPLLQIEVVELLAPHHPAQRLAVYPPLVCAERLRRDPLVEFVGLFEAAIEHLVKIGEALAGGARRQPQAHSLAAARWHVERVVRGGLRSGARRVYRV